MQSPSCRGLEVPFGTRVELMQVPLVLLSSRYHWCGSCTGKLPQRPCGTFTRKRCDRKKKLNVVSPPRQTSTSCNGMLILGAIGEDFPRP